MKKLLHYVVLTFGIVLTAHAQTVTPAGEKVAWQTLYRQARQMGQAFITGDYKTFSKFMHPALVKLSGGIGNLEAALVKVDGEMRSKGIKVTRIDFGAPSKIVRQAKEWQCTLLQQTDYQLPSGKIRSTSTLIAVSADSGASWTFIDTSNKDMQAIRTMLPNLSSAISIPPAGPPVRLP
ncbi:hypothetical protein ACX0G9_04450 [Flavitalea flava]